MSRKEQVMNLFNFMIELLDEPSTNKTEATPKPLSAANVAPTKRLKNETLPPHPLLNPYVSEAIPNGNIQSESLDKINSLFSKMAEIDKRNSDELAKLRAVKQATGPLIEELEVLRKQGHDNATKVKEEEEMEYLKPEIEKRMGVTIENGKTKIVEVPTTLRDNIPLDEGEQTNVGYSVNIDEKSDPSELKSEEDLPKHIQEKLEGSNMPQAIKDTLMEREKRGMEKVNSVLPDAIKAAMIKENTEYKPTRPDGSPMGEDDNNTNENK
jgi:seryl-tRNA synthetase